MVHQIVLGKNPSGDYQSLKVDSNGKLEVADSVVNVNTDALETKLDTQINSSIRGINNTGSIGDGSTNHTSVALGYDRSGGKGRALLVDADGHLQCDILSGGGGDATAANQLNMDSKLLDIKNAVEILDNVVSGSEIQADIVSSALPTDASTATLQGTIIGHLDGVEGELNNIDTAIDAMSLKLPASLGQKANSSSLSVCRSTTTGAFDMSARTSPGTASTSTKVLCDGGGRLEVKISNQSETHNVKLEDLSSSINADNSGHSRSIAVGLRAYTDITDRTSGKFLLADSAGRLKVENNAPIELFSDTSTTIAQNNTFTSSEISLVNGKKVGVLINTGSVNPSVSGKILVGFAGTSDQQLIGSSGSAVELPLAQIDGSGDYHATAVFDCPFPVLKVQLKNMDPTTITSLKIKVYQ